MINLNIRFHPDRDDLIFPDIDDGQAAMGEIVEVVVVANGVAGANGKDRPSVLFRIATPETTVVVPTTARLLVTLARAIHAKHPDLMEGE